VLSSFSAPVPHISTVTPFVNAVFVKSYSIIPKMLQGLKRNLNPTSPPGPSIFLTCLP
jgi:hypothetical protein